MSNASMVERAERIMLGNYRPAPIAFVQGEGCQLIDVEGRRYLDLCGGIAVVSVGHGHPQLAKAIGEQAARLMHVSNLFHNVQAIELAETLAQRTGFARFFFCNSGAEANEALLKLARRFHYGKGEQGRTELIAATSSFHGRTMGALALTGQSKYQEGLGPMVPGIHHVPFNDLQAMASAINPRTAAVLLEPVQGEGGVVVPSKAYLQGVRELCTQHGALLFFDEVQTGFGRTGRFLGREHSQVWPDACSLAKGIASGFPLGAIAVSEALVDALPPGSHATTFGGNPLACAAGLAVAKIMEEENLVARAEERGQWLAGALAEIVEASPHVAEARGMGLLQGLVLKGSVQPAEVLGQVREQGVLLSLAGGNVLRFTPPLCVTQAELAQGIAAVRAVLVGR